MSWCTIESDPGVFSELVHNLGCTDVQLEEIWGMDQLTDPGFSVTPVHGVIFLFSWKRELYANDARATLPHGTTDVFFAKQTVNNACATQAIIATLLNADDSVRLGDTLQNFKEFAGFVDYGMRGDLIGQQDQIRVQHNRFARPEPFVGDDKKEASEDDEAFHFISYVEKNGAVYELDGLRAGPILVGTVGEGQTWLGDVLKPEIERRCAELGDSIKFSIQAVVGNRKKAAVAKRAALVAAAAGGAAGGDGASGQIAGCDAIIQAEDAKWARWRQENTRRRHNYVPLAIGLLQAMAKAGKLMPAHGRAMEKAQKAREERIAKIRAEQEKQTHQGGGHSHGDGHGHSHGGAPCDGDH
jgi:ubiquitin carboxyl-terminal hydrolase L5